mmetsp:Transcript_41706/g.100035  ORF Transcript_41706/g.100035 Transcript_41706/m.100035 type:complete len:1191 (+) Transcript_41706:169-3741(+)
MVRAIPSVHVLSDPEHINNYLEQDGAALSPASKDSLLSNAAVSGTNMKRSKKLQSVLTKMTTGGGEEYSHQVNDGNKSKGRKDQHRRQGRQDDTSRITAAFDDYESREDHGTRQPVLAAAGDMTVGREQEEVRAAIRNNFFGSSSGNGTTPRGRVNDSQTKKKVYTSRSSQQVVSPRSRTRVSSPTRKEQKAGNNTRSSLSPVRGRRRRSSFSPRRRGSDSSSIDSNGGALERPSTPIRTGRNPSPPTRRTPTGSNRTLSSNRSDQWSYDSLGESTDKTSSSDYDTSTTGSFSVDRMRSMRRKIQKASQKNSNGNERSLSPRRKISRPQPDEDDDDNGGILPLLDIAGAATDFVSHLMDQILPESPGADQPRPPHLHSDYDLLRPSYDDTGDYDDNRQRRRRSPKRRDSPRTRNASSPRRRSSQKVAVVDGKKVSEVVKAAVNSNAYRDTDESVYSTSTEDGESLTYSVDETASTNVSSSVNEAKRTKSRRSETNGRKLAKTGTSGKVNGLVAKIEDDVQMEKTGKSERSRTDKDKLLADFDEEKATPQNLAVALSMSGEESLVSDEDYSGAEQDSLRQHMAKLKRDEADDPSLQRGNKSEESGREKRPKMPMLGQPVFPQGHKHELEAKIKESYERRMKNSPASESIAASEGVSPSSIRKNNAGNNKPLIPPDAPVASKKVAVNYINAIAKYFQPPSEHATEYVKVISKDDSKATTTDKNSVEIPVVKTKISMSATQDAVPTKSSGVGGGTKLEMDSLVSKIDGVVQKLIESGKLPSGNDSEGDDLQKRNTAELLKNLAILRSRRANSSVPQKVEQKHEKDDTKDIRSNHEDSKGNKESLKPKDDDTTDITSSLKPKEDDTTVIKSSDNSRLAAIRAKRDEAAVRIKEKTERLSDMHTSQQQNGFVTSLMSFPTFFAPHSAKSVSSRSSSSVAETVRSSRSHGSPPRPEDANSPNPIEPGDLPRVSRQKSTFAHLSSTRSVDDSFSPPPTRRQRTKSAPTRRSKSAPRSSTALPSNRPSPLNNRRSERPSRALYHHQMMRRDETLRSTASDAALKDWESNELDKLPLILNVSRTDGGSRDEYEYPRNQRASTQPKSLLLPNPYSSKRRPTYGRRIYEDEDLTFGGDDDNTDSDTSGSYTYDETVDTDSGSDDDYDTDGSESDGERLARIAEMVKELKKRQRIKNTPRHR